ncbi:MAG: SDR family oxidoreductase [Melioribacteraceae bacterium]|nr:SDR family oxidoreductase [Melioribacteraceae bacterium]
MNLYLNGKLALITAASKGIGFATADMLMEEGTKVVILSSNKNNIKAAAYKLKEKHNRDVFSIVCDLNSLESIFLSYEKVKKEFGEIDILVNNCGGPVPGNFESLSDEDWDKAYIQVLRSAVKLAELVLPNMKIKKWGRIINITSLSVKQPVDNLMLSNTFRTGLIGFAKSLSNEVGKYNITVNNVAPGYTLTSRLIELAEIRANEKGITTEDEIKTMGESVPLKRVGGAYEIASLITFLASEHSGYITGSTIAVDGGAIKSTF